MEEISFGKFINRTTFSLTCERQMQNCFQSHPRNTYTRQTIYNGKYECKRKRVSRVWQQFWSKSQHSTAYTHVACVRELCDCIIMRFIVLNSRENWNFAGVLDIYLRRMLSKLVAVWAHRFLSKSCPCIKAAKPIDSYFCLVKVSILLLISFRGTSTWITTAKLYSKLTREHFASLRCMSEKCCIIHICTTQSSPCIYGNVKVKLDWWNLCKPMFDAWWI